MVKAIADDHGEVNFSDSALATGAASYLKLISIQSVSNKRVFMMSWRIDIREACRAVDSDVRASVDKYCALELV